MRVLVATSGFGSLSPLQVGTAVAVGWSAEAGADVAVVPMADAGAGFMRAWAEQHAVEVQPYVGDGAAGEWAFDGESLALSCQLPNPGESWSVQQSSQPLGHMLRDVLADKTPRSIALDLSSATGGHDAGAGFLSGLGASANAPLTAGTTALAQVREIALQPVRQLLGEAELIGVIPRDQRGQRLLGLRGISAQRGHLSDAALEDAIEWDNALEAFAAAAGPQIALLDDAGACGGAAFGVLAVGGRIACGPSYLAEQAQVSSTVKQADLVITCVDSLDYVHRGGGVVDYLVGVCGDSSVPLVVIAGESHVGVRELRTFGVEAAYAVGVRDASEAEFVDLVKPIARSWRW